MHVSTISEKPNQNRAGNYEKCTRHPSNRCRARWRTQYAKVVDDDTGEDLRSNNRGEHRRRSNPLHGENNDDDVNSSEEAAQVEIPRRKRYGSCVEKARFDQEVHEDRRNANEKGHQSAVRIQGRHVTQARVEERLERDADAKRHAKHE